MCVYYNYGHAGGLFTLNDGSLYTNLKMNFDRHFDYKYSSCLQGYSN